MYDKTKKECFESLTNKVHVLDDGTRGDDGSNNWLDEELAKLALDDN